MVWCAINYNFRSRLLVIHGNLTARRFVDEILRPERRQRIPMLFQQDHALPHTARFTQDFLRQEGVNILFGRRDHRNLIRSETYGMCRAVAFVDINTRRRLRQLAMALQQEWDNIPRRTVRRLSCSV